MSDQQAAAAMIAANRRRATARRWIGIASIPFIIAAALLVIKLLSMVAAAHTAITAHVSDDPAGTIAAAQWQRPANWFEPYKAPYNAGVGSASAGALEQARAEFEEALSLASGLEVCAIRVNLSLVLEWMGDAAFADAAAAQASAFWQEALTMTLETPEECRSEEADRQSPDPERSLDESLNESQERLEEKLRDQPEPSEEPSEEPQPEPSESDLQELQDRLDDGAQEREDFLGDDGLGGGGTDRPW